LAGGTGVGEKDLGAPPEEREHDQERDDGPGDFQLQAIREWLGDLVVGLAAIFDGERKNGPEDQTDITMLTAVR
jgi:hypothetical protein